MTQESGSSGKLMGRKINTVVRIGDILLKAGIASSPVGATGVVAWEILQSITQHVLAAKEERDKNRALFFMETLLESRPHEVNAQEILDHEIDPNDLYTLLRGALQDDEDAKTIYYAELLRKIALGMVEEDYKLYMVKAVRELSSRDITLLGKLYVTDRFNIMPKKGGGKMKPEMWLRNTKVMDRLTNRNLIRLGLLDGDTNNLKSNSLTLLTAEILFRRSDLSPNEFGLVQWREKTAIILTPQHDIATSFSTRIQEALRECRVFSFFALLNNTLGDQVFPRTKEALIVILCIELEALHPSIDPRLAISRFHMLQNDIIIKILASPPGGNIVDFASEIQANCELRIELSSNSELSPLIEIVNQLLDTSDAA
jgi:hypothetical protein